MSNLPPSKLSDEDSLLLQELLKIENTFHSMTDDELLQRLKVVYKGYGHQTHILQPGMIIFRVVHTETRPRAKDRVQYPPASRAVKHGRLNCPGEVIFYGSPHNIGALFAENHFEVGKHYALSCWLVHEEIVVADCGYSSDVMKEKGVARQVPDSFRPPIGYETGRFEILRRWQSKIFVQAVAEGDEENYRLSIAIRKLFFPSYDRDRRQIAGLFYPSVALLLESDNIALLTKAVDDKLTLIEVSFHQILGIAPPDHRNVAFAVPKHLDTGRPDLDGNLVWGQKSQFIPKRSAEIKYLPPEYASGTTI